MHSRKNIFILTLLLACSIISQAQVQTDTTQNKTKFFDKIGHWVTAYMLGGPDFMQPQRNDFKSSAFAELYIEGSIVKDVWMFNMLNRITEMRHEQKQTPHILIKILLKPENEALSLYSVNLNVTASQNLPINLATIASQAVSKHLNKTPYSEPAYAVDDIEKALEEIFQNLKTALGNSLAPNLLLRYNNDIYWSGHEITVLANEGNSVEIEALDKNLQPIPSAQLTWTNASPFMHKGLVDLTNLNSQQVSVRRQQQGSQPDNATVTLKRVNVTEDINDLLKALIIEVLSAKKEEVQDTLNTLLQNRTENAEKIKQYIANLERYNFPMEGPASGSLMFPTPLYRADSAALMNTDNEQTRNIATSILALKKQKAIKRKIKIKANVAAFADLVVDNPERLEDLLDQLLRNSGSLIAQLILNRDNSGTRQTARNIVVDFINRNIERISGSAAMATPAETEPIIEIPVLPSAAPAFNPTRRLYLSASLPANTRQELESALSDYLNNLEQPLYVFVNYSHDSNTENYLSRAIGNKPVGIPEGARYKVYTIINIPGSIMENVVGEAGEVTATTAEGGIVEDVMGDDEEGTMVANPALVSFYQQAAPLLEKADFKIWIEKVRKVYEFLKDCDNERWESYNSEGIVPHCFWRDQNISSNLYYSNADLAFTAGLIDGAYLEAEGLYQLPQVVSDLSKLPGKIIYAYTLAYWECQPENLLASVDEYEYVIGQLALIDEEGGPWNWVKDQWYDYKEEKENLEKYFNDCRNADELRATIEDLYDLATNWEQIKVLSGQVYSRLNTYWNTLSSTTNVGRYQRGRVVIPAATIVVPFGIGVASKAKRLKDALKFLKESSPEDWKKFVDNLSGLLANGGENLAQSLKGALKSTYDDIIRLGGSAVQNNGVLKLLGKNGEEVAQIVNGKILPTKYFDDVEHAGATPVGQPANGYQVFKKGDDLVVKRMPNKSAYSTSELTELTQHPNAHTLERHGHDVTDEALIKRANRGIAPDGSYIGNNPLNPPKPPYSSKFETPQQLQKALNNTKPGTSAFNNTVNNNGRKAVIHELTDGSTYGKGVPRDGNTFQQAKKVRANYEEVSPGIWQLATMFPDF